jgi:prepilin-type N-terminal cleavage/methylation domain-containing protein
MIMKQKGFTIVELLIVIVVIAILAAITIVAFNGIQQRAKLAQVQSGVSQYVKALMQYSVENQSYPIAANTGSSMACFDGVNDCNGAANAASTAALSTAMRKYLPQDPVFPEPTNSSILMQWSSSLKFYIYFLQDGTGECVSVSGTTLGTNAIAGNGTQRVCRLQLPDPS